MSFWRLGGWTLLPPGASLPTHENKRGGIPRFFIDRALGLSAHASRMQAPNSG
jgi:hypothetical protein